MIRKSRYSGRYSPMVQVSTEMHGSGTPGKDTARADIATRTLKISMVVTIIIGIVELVFWKLSENEIFLIEGIGNLSWLVPDLVMLYTLGISSRKPDWSMHYGYRRAETIFLLFFSLIVAGLMLVLLHGALTGPQEPLPAEYGPATILLSLVIIVVLAFLGSYVLEVGRKIKSRLLILDSLVIRMDAASAVILLASGIFLVIMPSFHLIQIFLTVLVGLVLIAYCFNEARHAVTELLDANPSQEVSNLIEMIAEEVPEVRFVSDQRLRSFGGAISVDITIETDPDMTLREAYRVASGLEARIQSGVENVIEARVRVNPAGTYVEKEMGMQEDGTQH